MKNFKDLRAAVELVTDAAEEIKSSIGYPFFISEDYGELKKESTIIALEDTNLGSYQEVLQSLLDGERLNFRVVYSDNISHINETVYIPLRLLETYNWEGVKERGLLKAGTRVVPLKASNSHYSITSQSNGFIGEVAYTSDTGTQLMVIDAGREVNGEFFPSEEREGGRASFSVTLKCFVPCPDVGNVLYKNVEVRRVGILNNNHRDLGLVTGSIVDLLGIDGKFKFKNTVLEQDVDFVTG